MSRHVVTLSALALVLLAGCSGGGSSNPGAPLPQPTPTSVGQGSSRSITFTISFNKSQSNAHQRRLKYISPNTGSIGVAVNGGPATYSAVNCNGGSCNASVTVIAPVNQTDTFTVTAWTGPSGPNNGGVLLSEGSASTYITAGGTIVIPITLGGEVASIASLNLTNTSYTSGTSGSATLTVTARDPSGAVIVGCYAQPIPVRIFENDSLTAFSFSSQGVLTKGSLLGSGSTQDGCSANGTSLTLYYSGSATGPSFPADAIVAADTPTSEFFNFTWGQVNDFGLYYNGPDDTTTVLTELQTACPGGGVPCAYYQPALAPFLATLTGVGGAASGEPGSPAVWGTDNYTGLVAGITAGGAFTLYPTDGQIIGPPHSQDPNYPNYSIPDDLGNGDLLISNYQAPNLVEFKDGTNSQVFDVLHPAYTSAGFATLVGIAPSVFVADGSGNQWFVDPNTAAIDTASATGGSIVSCVLPFSDGVTSMAANALAVAGSTVWTSTVLVPASGPEAFYIARFPTSVSGSSPCTVPFTDEIPVALEVDHLAVDASGNAWYVDNSGNLGYIPAAGGNPVTQSFGPVLSSSFLRENQYLYALDSADNLLVRIDTTTPPPNAVVATAPLPANWNGITDNADNFNQVWLTQGAGTTIWFAGTTAAGLQAPTNLAFEIDPAQLTFGSGSQAFGRARHAAAHRAVPRLRARRPGRKQLPIRRNLPNFGF